MDDTLRIGSEFDPSGIISGVNVTVAQLNKLAATVEKTARQLPNLNPTDFMLGVADGLRDVAKGMEAVQNQAKTTTSASNQVAHGFARTAETGGTAFRKLERGLAGLAVQTSGTSGAVGQLAESFALSLGGPGALIGIAAIVTGYELLTKSSTDATKAREKLNEALSRRIEASQPVTTQISFEVAAAEEKRALLGREILKIQEEENQALKDPMFSLGNRIRLNKILLEQADEQRKVDQGILLIAEATTAAAQKRQDLFSGLGTQLAAVQTGDPFLAEDAARKQAIASTQGLTDKQRAAAAVMADLITKLERLKKAHEDAEKAAHDQAQFFDQLDAAGRRAAGEALVSAKDWGKAWDKSMQEARDAASAFAKNTQEAISSLLTPEEIHLEFLQKQRQAFLDVADAAAGLIQTATSVGLIGQKAGDAALAAISLADALNKINLGGATFANVLGGISAGIGLIGTIGGSLFGESASSREIGQITRENTNALRDATAAFNHFAEGISSAGTSSADLSALLADPIIHALETTGLNVSGGDAAENLDRQLRALGSSLEELDAVARDNGIELLDSQGHLVAGALSDLDKVLRMAVEAATHFGTSLSDIEAQISAHAKLFGGSDLGQNRDVLLAGLNLDPGLEGRIAALDLDTEAGRKAYLDFLKQLYNMAAAGQLTAEQLGKFANLEDLLAVLGQGADDSKTADQEAADAAREKAQADKDAADAAKELAAQQRAAGIAAGQNIISRQSILEQLQGATASIADRLRAEVIGTAVGANGDTGTQVFLQNVGSQNFEDPAIRAALRKKLIGWIEAANAGQMTADQLGLTDDQFMQFLQSAAESLNALDQAAADAAKAQRDQARQMENLHSRLVGDPQDAVGNFQRELDILSQSIPELSGAFDGLDLSSGANADAIRKKLLELFDQAGNIDPGLKDEFLNFLGLGADALDELTKSANDATKSLTNVPQGLNLAEFEWRARMAAPPGGGSSLTGIHFTDPIGGGTPPFRRGTDGAMQPMITGGVQITIQGATKSPQEIAKEVVRELSRVGMNRRGVPSGTVGLG